MVDVSFPTTYNLVAANPDPNTFVKQKRRLVEELHENATVHTSKVTPRSRVRLEKPVKEFPAF